jgi:hypothetical protein
MIEYPILTIALIIIIGLFIWMLHIIHEKVMLIHNQVYYLEHQLNELKKIKRIQITQWTCEPTFPEIILKDELD